MMDRTLLSELVSEDVKQRRMIICTKVIDATSLLEPPWILRRVLFGEWTDFSRCIHFGRFVQTWKEISDPVTAFYAQFVVAVTLASVKTRDERWFELASGQLNESKSYLRSYYATGDSILLANTIFIIRRAIQTSSGSKNREEIDIEKVSSKLELLCRFDIQDTLAEHQHMFCSFWNQLVEVAHAPQAPRAPPRNSEDFTNRDHHSNLCVTMLKSIRRLYVALHGIPKGDPNTLGGDPNTPSLLEIPNIRLGRARSPNAYGQVLPDAPSLYDPSIYTTCTLDEHRHSEMPGLPLNWPPIASPISMDKIRISTAMLIPVLPPTIPTVTSHRAHTPSRPRLHPEMASSPNSSRVRLHRDEPATTAEAYSRDDIHWRVISPSPPSSIPPGADMRISRPASAASTSLIMPETPFVPPQRPGTAQLSESEPQGRPVVTNTDLKKKRKKKKKKSRAPVSFNSAEDLSLPRNGATPPVLGPSRGSITTPPQGHQPILISPPDTGMVPIQVPLDTSSSHSTDESFATVPSAPSSSVSFTPPVTWAGREGDPAQTPLTNDSVIKLKPYGEFSGLLHYSLHSVLYEGKIYPTALHLFEARKFLPYRRDLAKRVRQCERVEQVPWISAELADFVRQDWVNIRLDTVSKGFTISEIGYSLTGRLIADGRMDT